ncbi:hypothetical protein PYW07_012210 [Mythimna separata]|uniref:Uncharacterized protein n=1 Tax=Mythimna separata TaxID=271217 RepID=A0AAD7YMY3_MYTSE|nr:hypothetical protein PYW07_012210 [Mythimna separata]
MSLEFSAFTVKTRKDLECETKNYKMSEFMGVLCAIVMSLNSVYTDAPLGLGDINTILLDCAKENKVTNDQLRTVVTSQDTKSVNSCFFACLFKRSKIMNDKGEFDVKSGLTYVRQVLPGRPETAVAESIIKECESVKNTAVNDGEAGCERAALLVACLLEQTTKKARKPK